MAPLKRVGGRVIAAHAVARSDATGGVRPPDHPGKAMPRNSRIATEKMLETEATEERSLCRVLTLDGGGSKGFYTLGVLKELEAMLGGRLYEHFSLIYGTSTGSIIATLLCLGMSVDEILELYQKHVPTVMKNTNAKERTKALESLATQIYGDKTFHDVKTGIGVVATRWATEVPMIFKAYVGQAHGLRSTFVPGFGVKIADAVQASCSAYPFFTRKEVETTTGDKIELIDGGFCANNPTLYAIADATRALGVSRENIRVVSVGVGVYPEPKPGFWVGLAKKHYIVQLLQKTLEINTQSMEALRTVLFNDVPTIRISDAFTKPEMATDLLEHNLAKLNALKQRGRESFAARELELKAFLA